MFELVALEDRAEDAGGVGTGGGAGLRVLEAGVVVGGFVGVALRLTITLLIIIVVKVIAIPLNCISIITHIPITPLLPSLLPVPQQPPYLILLWHLFTRLLLSIVPVMITLL